MNEKRVNKKRLCCRPGCGRPAAATLVYSHAEETVIVGPLSLDDNPHSWDLCARHSAQFRPPEGWTVIRDEPNVDDVDDMTALLDSVNDPQGGNHRVDAGSVAGPGARFGAGSGARHADATQGAVADIQDTISRLNGHRGEAACHRNEKRTFSTGPSTMRSQADRHGADGYAADAYNNDGYNNDPGTDSDDDLGQLFIQARQEAERDIPATPQLSDLGFFDSFSDADALDDSPVANALTTVFRPVNAEGQTTKSGDDAARGSEGDTTVHDFAAWKNQRDASGNYATGKSRSGRPRHRSWRHGDNHHPVPRWMYALGGAAASCVLLAGGGAVIHASTPGSPCLLYTSPSPRD